MPEMSPIPKTDPEATIRIRIRIRTTSGFRSSRSTRRREVDPLHRDQDHGAGDCPERGQGSAAHRGTGRGKMIKITALGLLLKSLMKWMGTIDSFITVRETAPTAQTKRQSLSLGKKI